MRTPMKRLGRSTAGATSALMLAAIVAASAVALTPAHASDLPVTYSVQDKPLKTGSVAGTPLVFTLYSDAACTQQLYQATIPVENVTLISKLKRLTPKGATKAPTTDEIRATLPGVTAGGNLYLAVTGAGLTPSGATCQVQAGAAGPHGPTVTGILRFSGDVNWYFEAASDPSILAASFYGAYAFAAGRQAALVLAGLDPAIRYSCDLATGSATNSSAGSINTLWGLFVPIFDMSCTALPPSCSDGLQNQDESSADCGGTICGPCQNFRTCNVGADCASGVCQPYPLTSVKVCVAATCSDGVMDNGETATDCGGRCASASSGCPSCSAGQACVINCDCLSYNCSGGVCQ